VIWGPKRSASIWHVSSDDHGTGFADPEIITQKKQSYKSYVDATRACVNNVYINILYVDTLK